jgi:peptidoglycan/xylan/chitin deacetylase (PgdA/CDA1 family)
MRARNVLHLGRRISYRLAVHVRRAPLRPRPAGPIVSFTFDDAPESAGTLGAAILEEHGIRGTFYLSGALLGRNGDCHPILDRSQAARLAADGHEIGCHTLTHRDVRDLSTLALARELDANAQTLSELTDGAPLRSFAYPFGGVAFSAKLQLQSRFETCRGVIPGINAGTIDVGLLRAVPLYSSELDLAGIGRWIATAARRAGWLVFFTHDIGGDPSPFGATPDLLRGAIRAAQAAGCVCLPVGCAVDYIRGRSQDAQRAARGLLARPVRV